MPRVLLLSLLLTVRPTAALVPLAMRVMHKFAVRNAQARGAICNDGSSAVYYFRDCPRPESECVQLGTKDWLVVFADGAPSDACFDDASCKARAINHPNRTSSKHLNATLAADFGIFSWNGEQNPNFYAQRTVLVPYCSSDLWLGNASSSTSATADGSIMAFRGAAIARAVLEDLATTTFSTVPIPSPIGPGPNHTRLDEADSIALVGGVGIMAQLQELAALVPSKPRQALRAVCDGCLIVDIPPLTTKRRRTGTAAAAAACTEASTCPPSMVLQRGVGSLFWQPPPRHRDWHSLLAMPLLANLPTAIPAMIQHPQYDEAQLRQNGAWPVSSSTAAYAQRFAASVRAAMRSRPGGGLYTFAAACSPASPSLFRADDSFFCRPVACSNGNGGGEGGGGGGRADGSTTTSYNATFKLSSVAHAFLKDPTSYQPVCLEDCGGFDCNPFCQKPRCWP